jgi:hypothetical protein
MDQTVRRLVQIARSARRERRESPLRASCGIYVASGVSAGLTGVRLSASGMVSAIWSASTRNGLQVRERRPADPFGANEARSGCRHRPPMRAPWPPCSRIRVRGAQAFGEAVNSDRLVGLIRYEVHLDRTVATLFKLKELRRAADPS